MNERDNEFPSPCDISFDLHEVEKVTIAPLVERSLGENPYFRREIIIRFKTDHAISLTLFAKEARNLGLNF